MNPIMVRPGPPWFALSPWFARSETVLSRVWVGRVRSFGLGVGEARGILIRGGARAGRPGALWFTLVRPSNAKKILK